MSDIITDGDFTAASAVSGFRYSAPFSQFGIKDLYVFEQDFVIAETSFSPLAIDTAHPTLAAFFLVIESAYQPVSINSIVRWTRRYAQVPASFSRPGGNYPYTFPVKYTGDLTTSRLFPKPLTVNARIQVDFFHTSDPDSIAIIEPTRYINTFSGGDATSPWGEPVVANAGFSVTATNPDLTTYNAWVSGGIEIVPEASKITPNWNGNIHMRETIYVKAH